MNGVVADMQTTMCKVLAMGMTLYDVIKLSTINPANEIGHPELGHLSIGSCADVAVYQLHSGSFGYVDCGRAKITGDKNLECAMTIRNGAVAYDVGGLSMPHWTEAPASYWGR